MNNNKRFLGSIRRDFRENPHRIAGQVAISNNYGLFSVHLFKKTKNT